MNHRIKPATRLSIVFIIAVVISGSVLTWFSINNISNLKELTEKRIIEEQRCLSERFSIALNQRIERLASAINIQYATIEILKDSLVRRAVDTDFILETFILKNNGDFFYPYFVGIPETSLERNHSDRYFTAFTKGEESEFARNDLAEAKKNYLECLRYSATATDSVRALNALGRICVKLNDFKSAFDYYNSLIINHFDETGEDGNPWIYFAVSQLMKISSPESSEKTLILIEFCLEKMDDGPVPLNLYAAEMLNHMREWLSENNVTDQERLQNVNKLIAGLNRQLQFVDAYGKELSELTHPGGSDSHLNSGSDLRIVSCWPDSSGLFFLVGTKNEYPAGLLADRQQLFNEIVDAGLQSGFEFDYRIDFQEGYNSGTPGNNLILTSQLNPWFSGHLIRISLADDNVIKDLIRRRSWIYGGSSLLLLLAMALGIALILRDIAREKHLARLRSDFISNVTHELKTPLTSIRMYAESMMMERVRPAARQKKYLSVVVNESERLKRMINNILEFSKMEKARQEYHPVDTNISEILLSALRELNYWLEEKGFTVINEIERTIRAKLDPEKFRQVITNLLSNAIKYSGDSRKIFVRLYENPDSVVIEVEDEGIGIDKDQQSKIFEEFYRVERQESGDIAGTGLGLTVVKEIVEAHGGKVLVDSEIGRGSKFSVILSKHSKG